MVRQLLTVCSAVLICLEITLALQSEASAAEAQITRASAVGDCCPQKGVASKELCNARGCTWNATSDNSPYCTFPQDVGYKLVGELPTVSASGFEVLLSRINTTSLFGDDVEDLKLTVTFETSSRLHVKFADVAGTRYQVPKEAVNITYDPSSPPANETRLYDVEWETTPRFGLRVKRRSTGAVVFDTTTPGFVFSDQYLQLTLALPSANVYGFGEHNHRRFQHDMDWKRWSIFTRDEAPVGEWNLYGAQTMYMNLENDGNANSVFLLNSNAMDVVLQPSPYPAITYHVIGGILDFYIFLGPTPENVVQQYTEAVGRPLMPPYWSLGFQLSRWDYGNLTNVQQVVERNRLSGIPQDVQYGDIDYMESKLDFTYDKVNYAGLPEFVETLHNGGQKYIIILDHVLGSDKNLIQQKLNGSYFALSDGIDKRVFIFDPRNKAELLYGEVWPGESVYPDFTLGDNVTSWWKYHCELFRNGDGSGSDKGIKYDALWIDMNEPSNFVPGSTTGCERNRWNYPPYVPNILGAEGSNGSLFDKTICMDAEQKWGRHYDVHSLYGHSMAITTFRALRDIFPTKRPLVLTRSTFAGTQKYGAHWLGDNQSFWNQIPWSIIGMLEFSLFGFSYTGSDICGFYGNTTEQMCQRWMQLGAFYPYSRNHNMQGFPDQDPAAFSDEMVRVSREILLTRYKLLPFLYTLLHEAHVHGSTVVRPLLHEFTTDKNTWSIDRQFLWGPSFMVSPVMEEDVTWVNAYVPKGTWYDFYTGDKVESTGSYYNLSTPLDKIQLHVRAGYIIPWQEPANTTVYSRQKPMGLLVALDRGSGKQTKGNLFWDDGESFETFQSGNYLHLEFTATYDETFDLDITVVKNGFPQASSLVFDTIDIYGIVHPPRPFYVNKKILGDDQVTNTTSSIRLSNLKLRITENHQITWSSYDEVEISSPSPVEISSPSPGTDEVEISSPSPVEISSPSPGTDEVEISSPSPGTAAGLSQSACVVIAALLCTLVALL